MAVELTLPGINFHLSIIGTPARHSDDYATEIAGGPGARLDGINIVHHGTTTGLHATNGKPVGESLLRLIAQRTEVVLIDCGADCSTQLFFCRLVGPKMYPAVDTCIGDIVGDLSERRVLQHDVGHCRIRLCDRMSSFAVKTFSRGGLEAVHEWQLSKLNEDARKGYVAQPDFAAVYAHLRRKEEALQLP